jgi:Na+-translocating ferredoxin:NAD+ oxidoreductase RnfD subunit
VSEEKPPRENDIPTGGIFLLFAGIVLLLQSLDVLPWSLWDTLWRFWPVLLIISGLSLLLRRYNAWLVSLVLLALLFACLGLAIWQQEKPLPSGQGTASSPASSGSLLWSQSETDSQLSF